MLLALRASSNCTNLFLRAFDALFAEVLGLGQLNPVVCPFDCLTFYYRLPHYKHISDSAQHSSSKSIDRRTVKN